MHYLKLIDIKNNRENRDVYTYMVQPNDHNLPRLMLMAQLCMLSVGGFVSDKVDMSLASNSDPNLGSILPPIPRKEGSGVQEVSSCR